MKNYLVLLVSFCLCFFAQDSYGQVTSPEIGKNYIASQSGIFQDIPISSNDLTITSSHVSKQNGVHHIYFQQLLDGIEIHLAVASVHINDQGKVIHATNNFVNIHKYKISKSKGINVDQAIEKTAGHFNLNLTSRTEIVSTEKTKSEKSISKNPALSQGDITSHLVYVTKNNNLRLAWNVSFEKADNSFWWNVRVDAATGEVIDKNSWTVECNFDYVIQQDFIYKDYKDQRLKPERHPDHKSSLLAPDSYRVFDAPLEAPTEGSRTLVVDPADPTASEFGWHDTTGVAGAEFTDTRGNNVFAQEDTLANNSANGFRPDGGAGLDFDFTADTSMAPRTYLSAAITNLFYWNNLIHDITYHYGFDEAGGNFQANNYGNGGEDDDWVWADAQDGSGTNNANFSTPPDGFNPRMQMFEWIYSTSSFEITSPPAVAGFYNAPAATFGPIDAGPLNSELVIASPSDGCTAITNGGAINGKIAVINRGNCDFDLKVGNAEAVGAIAAMVCDSVPGSAPFSMGSDGDPVVTIPSVMLSKEDCDLIKPHIPTVNVTAEWILLSHTDSDFDNGIIAHEYGHGISNRLTGGPGNSGCLSNDEQMGEGWSDFFGMILTQHPGDLGSDGRGVGTYVLGQDLDGSGIRAFRYSTDMNINPHTYDDIKTTGTSPHALGTVWNTMLWDMTWLLIDKHGFDTDIYTGTGGNNIAMQLVIDGMKMQGCSPGFIEGRDAILMADTINNGAANSCEIWTAFARRGLGVSANQGPDSNDRTDGTEAFDLPAGCDLNLCTSQDRTYTDETIPDGTDEKANDFIKTTGAVDVLTGTSVNLSAKNNIDVDGIFTAEDGSTVQMIIDDTCKAFGIPGSFAPETATKSKIVGQNSSK